MERMSKVAEFWRIAEWLLAMRKAYEWNPCETGTDDKVRQDSASAML
jgi:hypothetical protein